MSKIIYIAGPIGNGGHAVDPREMYANVRRAENIMQHLMNRGWTVICPHLSYHAWLHFAKDMPYQRWTQMDNDFIKVSDALFYMRPEDYGPSKGASEEYALAIRLGKTVYTDLSQVPKLDPATGDSF